jgi:lipoprotein-anchoring transpeptidase ErfK/SrfK
MDSLSIGDQISIPSRDVTMLEDPITNKRIVVDIRTQYLVAFENGQVVFQWPVSTGVRNAETFPGVFQILSHKELAYGSSNILCNRASVQCGQWEMRWFMGIYEIQEGLVNGFHGSVLLPNGGYLGDGAIGEPVTFGCVMSGEEEAQRLYEWAEVGTVVEILSDRYAPKSDLGRLALRIAQAQNNSA